MDKKTEYRILAKNIRKGLDINNISRKLCEKIQKTDIYRHAKHVMIFYPLPNEIDTTFLISDNKSFYLPRVKNLDLEICPYKFGDELKISSLGIYEPITNPVSIEILDLIIVPALAVDKNNYRLGYGKGYYDRLIEKTNATTILPISKELIFDFLPTELHDKKVDIVISL